MKKNLLMAFLMLCSVLTARSQDKAVSGKVTGEDGAPLPGVSVAVKGTSVGTQTDLEGNFELNLPQEAQTLVFSYIGFTTVEEVINGRTVIDLQLSEDVEALSEVVVTALGISREKKALGYSATAVNAEEINRTSPISMLDGLQGKIAGVSISSQSGSPGASTKVILRGYSSLEGSNQPLYIIDGVPVDNGRFGTDKDEFNRSLDLGNNANDINPSDIASINVLKGAGATSLYGSRAANGVIVITTKKGQAGKLKVNFNSTTMFSSVLKVPELQNVFGQGWSGHYISNENGSWGPKMNGEIRTWGNMVDNSQLIKPFAPQENNVLDFYNYGKEFNNSISLSGGSDRSTFYFSYSNLNSDGIIPTNSDSYDRNSFSLRGATTYGGFTASASMNYLKRHSKAVPTGQGTAEGATTFQDLIQIPRDFSIVDFKDIENKFFDVDNFYTPYAQNPYSILLNSGNDFNTERVYGNFDLGYMFSNWFNVKAVVGTDITNTGLKDWQPISSPVEGSPNDSRQADVGGLTEETYMRREFNTDLMLNFSPTITEDITLDGLVGWNYNQRNYRRQTSRISTLTIPGFYELSNSPNPPVSETDYVKRRLTGLYAQTNFAYRNFLYLSLSARNDWSSTLPKGNNSFFYPGANLSFVLTDAIDALNGNSGLSFAKLRASWGMTGNDASPYLIDPVLVSGDVVLGFGNIVFPINGVSAFEISNQLGNSTLKPELTREYEFGTELRFLDNRIGLDLAYYDRLTKDQILPVDVASTSGYTTLVTNFGKIQNRGIEVALNLTPVQTDAVKWDLTYTFTKNKNKVVELPAGLLEYPILGAYDVDFVAEVGKPLGIYKGPDVVRDPDGNVVVNPSSGLPVLGTNQVEYGTSQADYMMGLYNRVSYKNLALGFSLDYRKGGMFYSYTSRLTHFVGNARTTLYNDRQPFVIPNSVNAVENEDGSVSYVENTTALDQENFYSYFNGSQNAALVSEESVIDRDFFKLRDVTLTYTFPQSVAEKIRASNVSLSAIGRNLFIWVPSSNTFIDPEVTTYSNDLTGEFGEFAGGPTVRSYGLSLKVTF